MRSPARGHATTSHDNGALWEEPQAGARTMPLRDTLQTILIDYAEAKGQPFAGHASGPSPMGSLRAFAELRAPSFESKQATKLIG
jgi:hypothetical protein